jgi:hypothetical protein
LGVLDYGRSCDTLYSGICCLQETAGSRAQAILLSHDQSLLLTVQLRCLHNTKYVIYVALANWTDEKASWQWTIF